MFFVIFILVISSFLFYVFRLWLWLITVCPYRSSQPTLVEFDRFSRSRTTRSCVFAANIIHGESISFTSMGERIPPPPVADEGRRSSNEQRLVANGSAARSLLRIVTVGSSPTVTTTKPLQYNACKGFSYFRMLRFKSCRQLSPATRSHREIRTLPN